MTERKYQWYEIIIKFSNGDKEEINMLHETEINKSNYKEMLKVYNEIKEQYRDKECVIEFCGSSNDSTLNVIFTKEFKHEEDVEVITNDKPIDKSLKELVSVINSINEREKYLDKQCSLLNKEQDFLLHKIELSEEDVSLDEIVDTYKNIKRIRINRRDVKNEKILLEYMRKDNFKENLGVVLEMINKLHIDKRENRINELKAEAKEIYSAPLEQNQFIKTVFFRTHKERLSLMKQLQSKYNKIVVDDEKKTISCFNYCSKKS